VRTKFLSVIFIFNFLIACSVNNSTGLITIYNLTDAAVTNIKIGDTVINYSLPKGQKYDHWFLSSLQGKVSGTEFDEVLAKFFVEDPEHDISYIIYKDDPVCTFYVNYEYHLDIVNADNKIRLYVNPGIQAGETTKFDYPAN
jgi:hypothetical protein